MANHMYDAVHKMRSKWDKKFWIALVAALVLLAVTGTPALRSVIQRNEFRHFAEDLAQNSSLSMRKGTVTLEMDGETFPLEAANDYNYFIRQLTTVGPGRKNSAPAEPPEAVVHFSTGAKLELWSVNLQGYSTNGRSVGLYLRYTYRDGKVYSDENGLISPSSMIRMLVQSVSQ